MLCFVFSSHFLLSRCLFIRCHSVWFVMTLNQRFVHSLRCSDISYIWQRLFDVKWHIIQWVSSNRDVGSELKHQSWNKYSSVYGVWVYEFQCGKNPHKYYNYKKERATMFGYNLCTKTMLVIFRKVQQLLKTLLLLSGIL